MGTDSRDVELLAENLEPGKPVEADGRQAGVAPELGTTRGDNVIHASVSSKPFARPKDPMTVVIYGGIVAEQSIDELARLEVLDGVGATRVSLEARTLLSIVDRLRPA